jgi:hypothetical protein
MARRILRGVSPFRAGRDHMHHLLLGAGYSHAVTALMVSAASLAMAALAWMLHQAHLDLAYTIVIGALVMVLHTLAVLRLSSISVDVENSYRFQVESALETGGRIKAPKRGVDQWR